MARAVLIVLVLGVCLMPSLRTLAFGKLAPGQARAFRQVPNAAPEGITQSQFAPLPGEEMAAEPDLTALPSNESLMRSPSALLSLQGGGETTPTGAGGSGAVPFGATDDPNAYLNKLAELPGFQQPPAETPVSEEAAPPVPSDTQVETTAQARGLQRLGGGETTTSDQPSPVSQAIESIRKSLGTAKQSANAFKALTDLTKGGQSQNSENAFQQQRVGERADYIPLGLPTGNPWTTFQGTPSGGASGASMPSFNPEMPSIESFIPSGEGGGSGGGPPDMGDNLSGAFGQAGTGLGTAAGGLGLLSGILNRNPFTAAMGGIQAGSGLSQLAGGPSLTSYLGSMFPSAASAGAEGAGFAGAGAGGAAAAGEAIPAGAAGLVGLGLAPFTIALSNYLLGVKPGQVNPLQETNAIRSAFSRTWPQFSGAGETYGRFGNLEGQGPEEQAATLRGILENANQARSAIPAISQFTSTQGGRKGSIKGDMLSSFLPPSFRGVKPLDVSPIERQTPNLYMLAALSGLGAEDLLAQRGINPYDAPAGGGFHGWDIGQTLDLLSQQGGANVRQPGGELVPFTPEESGMFSNPGNRLQGLASYFGRLNPNYASSPLGQAVSPFLKLAQPTGALANLASVQSQLQAARQADLPRIQNEEQVARDMQAYQQRASQGLNW